MNTSRQHSTAIVLAAAAFASATFARNASAWGDLVLIDARPEVATRAIGASVWSLPRYPGASGNRTSLWPAFDWYSPSGIFVSTENGVGWNLSSRQDVQAGFRLWPQPGRGSGEGHAGLSRIGVRIQQEAFFNVQALPTLLVQSGLLHGGGRHADGMKFEVGATSGIPIGKDLLGIGIAATFANHVQRQGTYGVSKSDSASSGLASTNIPAGWQDVNLTLSTEHRFDAHWHADGQIVLARLVGSARARPVFASRRQAAATFSVWHDF